jgi:hypothetical protein
VGERHFEKNFENPLKIKPETAHAIQDEYRTSTGQVQDSRRKSELALE